MVTIVSCENCDSNVEKYQYELESSNNYFCSTECHNEFQTESIEKDCPTCGGKFQTKKYDETKYCSKSCYGKSKESKVLVDCSLCGKSVKYHPYRIEEQDNFYCSTSCRSAKMSENWKGESNPNYSDGRYREFGENWLEMRQKIRERADGNCEGCGKSKEINGRKLDVHHVVPRSFFIESDEHCVENSNTNKNLVALCQSCHAKEETVCKKVLNNIIL